MENQNFTFGSDQRPDDGECAHCGTTIEPIQGDDGTWYGPPGVCDECNERREQKRKREERAERLKAAFHAAVGSARHRQLARNEVAPRNDLVGLLDDGGDPVHAMYLHGPAGTGKTTQCVSLVWHFLRREIWEEGGRATAQYADETRLFSELRDSFDDPDTATSEIRRRYQEADLLVLDDLGTSQATEWVAEEIEHLINVRYESLKPTLFASNASLPELREIESEAGVRPYDDRVFSRIYEMTGKADDERVIHMTENYRVE